MGEREGGGRGNVLHNGSAVFNNINVSKSKDYRHLLLSPCNLFYLFVYSPLTMHSLSSDSSNNYIKQRRGATGH